MNRFISILFLFITFGLAQAANEGWYKFPLISEEVQDIVEASNKVYYLSGGSLFSYSPEDDEAYAYSSLNKLTGHNITGIYYNYDSKYLAIAYEGANIDILYDNGRVINLPDIRDAQFTTIKSINHITFGDGLIVVATSFGIVIYREDKMEVLESAIYDKSISIAAVKSGRLFINYSTSEGHKIFWAPMDERHNTLDKFAVLGGLYATNMVFLDDKTLLAINKTTKRIYLSIFTYSINRMDTKNYGECFASSKIYQHADGYYAFSDSVLYKIKDANEIEAIELPEMLRGNQLAFNKTSDVVWAADKTGLGQYDISGSTPTVLYDRMTYPDGITCNTVAYMRWSNDNNRLYISNIGCTVYKSFCPSGENNNLYQLTNVIDNGVARDVSLKNASALHPTSIKHQANNGNKRMYGDPAWMVEDPDNPDRYYLANNHEGLYVIEYNPQTEEYEEVVKFTHENSPLVYASGPRCQAVNIDSQGNLWIGYQMGNRLSVLPAAKRKQDLTAITKDDWIEHPVTANCEIDQKDMMIMFCKKSNMMFVFTGKGHSGFVAIDTKGTYSNPADDIALQWTLFTDQDGNEYEAPDRITFALEDRRGCVWIGTSAGVFEITNPANATNKDMKIRRIKVPRNDGTNYADYLLETDMIYWISEDPSGRKWIATENSGLFLVSETGDEIILNYNEDNSPLPSNVVCSVETDPYSNTVYVGTSSGLYSFLSDSSPAKADYSEICAYPNPVRPEFYGDVTISGLMDQSIVKIADVAGNVVAHLRSEGGMARWNVCNLAGERVKSGVYYVYATSGSEGTSKAGAVTKILVIN